MKHLYTFENYSLNEGLDVEIEDHNLLAICQEVAKSGIGNLMNQFKEKKIPYKETINKPVKIQARSGLYTTDELYDCFVAISTMEQSPKEVWTDDKGGIKFIFDCDEQTLKRMFGDKKPQGSQGSQGSQGTKPPTGFQNPPQKFKK